MASSNVNFEKLGLTDVALLEIVTADTPLLTVDFDLYLVPFPVRFVDTGRLPITLDSCLRGND